MATCRNVLSYAGVFREVGARGDCNGSQDGNDERLARWWSDVRLIAGSMGEDV